jgi:LysR family transcriptional regulator for bpeEF and oprC
MQTIKCLELFKAVAEHKSFTKAAALQNLSPAVVTRAIQKLETELGVRLLHRTTRKLAVTDVGMTVYERTVTLLDSYSEIKGIGETSSGTMSGTVRVAIQRVVGFDTLSSMLDGYMQSHHNVALDIDVFDAGQDPLGAGADIAISVQSDVREQYIAKPIGSLSLSLFAGVRFSAHTNAISPSDLRPQERMSVGGKQWGLVAAGSGRRLSLPCDSRFRSASAQAIAMAAVQGFGIALLPPAAAKPYVDAGQLFPVFEAWSSDPVPVSISYRSRQFQPERVRNLIAYVSENMDRGHRPVATPALPNRPAAKAMGNKGEISRLLTLEA